MNAPSINFLYGRGCDDAFKRFAPSSKCQVLYLLQSFIESYSLQTRARTIERPILGRHDGVAYDYAFQQCAVTKCKLPYLLKPMLIVTVVNHHALYASLVIVLMVDGVRYGRFPVLMCILGTSFSQSPPVHRRYRHSHQPQANSECPVLNHLEGVGHDYAL